MTNMWAKTKTCTQCNHVKDRVKEFYDLHNKRHKFSECKECHKLRQKKYRENPEVREHDNERKRLYYKNNTDKCRTMCKKWQQEHLVYMRIRALITYYKRKWNIVEDNVQQHQWTPVNESLERLYDRLNKIKKKAQLVKAGRK